MIFRKNTLLALALTLSAGTVSTAQVAMPYATGFDTDAQKSGWQQFRKGAQSEFYEWEYNAAGAYTAPGCLVHNYPVGGSSYTDDWFVSPAFSLPQGGKIDSLYTSFAGFGLPSTADTLAVYLLSGSADPALATAKTLLYDYRDTRYSNDNTWRNSAGTAINIPNTPGLCYIGIRYKTVANWLDVKFDNISIRSNSTTGISERSRTGIALNIAPNPASNSLSIHSNVPFTHVTFYDLSGKIVLQAANRSQVDVSSLPGGTYIAECCNKEGDRARARFVKQ